MIISIETYINNFADESCSEYLENVSNLIDLQNKIATIEILAVVNDNGLDGTLYEEWCEFEFSRLLFDDVEIVLPHELQAPLVQWFIDEFNKKLAEYKNHFVNADEMELN